MNNKPSYNVLLLIVTFAMGLAGGEALAGDSYRTELVLDHSRLSNDGGYEQQLSGASAEIYFEPVNVKNHPLAEAAFLERVGSVFFLGGRGNADSPLLSAETRRMYIAGISYAKAESPFVGAVVYSKGDWDYDTPDATWERDAYLLGTGWYVTPTGLVSLAWIHGDSEFGADGWPDRNWEDDTYSVGFKYVGKFASGAAYNVESKLSVEENDMDGEKDSINVVALAGDYYLSRRLSLGGGIELSRGSDESREGNTYTATARWFITPRLSAEVETSWFIVTRAEQKDENERSTDLTLALRF